MPNIVYPIKFKLQETLSKQAIEGAFISIWNNSFTSLIIPNITTDINGFATVGLPIGIYNAVFFCKGFTFPDVVFFHVENTPLDFIVEGDITIISPIAKGYCVLYGYVKDVAGNPIIDSKIKIRINPSPQYKDDEVFSKEDYTLYTNIDGYFETRLLGGARVTVTIPEANYQIVGVLPSTGKIDLLQLNHQFTQI